MSVSLYKVDADDDGQRIDRWFRNRFPGLSQGQLEKLLRTGQIRLNGGRIKASARLEEGQEIRIPPITIKESAPLHKRSESRKSDGQDEEDREFLQSLILYEDRDVIVINKPAGLAVQGGTGTKVHLDGMLDGLKNEKGDRPKLVHRLDRDTSGVLVLARHGKAASSLSDAFRTRETRKIYWAICVGVPRIMQGTIDLPLAKGMGAHGREKMLPEDDEMDDFEFRSSDAKRAVTHYSVAAHAGRKLSFVALMPITGRTHQLRAHLAAIDTPVLGDGKYGGAEAFIEGLPRQLHLHARELTIRHPNGTKLTVAAPLSDHMKKTFSFCGFEESEARNAFAGLKL